MSMFLNSVVAVLHIMSYLMSMFLLGTSEPPCLLFLCNQGSLLYKSVGRFLVNLSLKSLISMNPLSSGSKNFAN